jgi:hypothetical protein
MKAATRVVRPTRKPTTRFPNSISAWWLCSGRKVSPQRGQFSQPRPDPVSRTVAPLTVTRMSATSAA